MAPVQAILLISSDRVRAEVHIRTGRLWNHHAVTARDKFIELPLPRCILPIAEIYEGVDLRRQPKAIR